tara:strand:+ start:107 stop:406 length:300 start_codon:yes stop_codon:yes gene_type:complete
MTLLFLKDLTSKKVSSLDFEVELNHGYAQLGWIKPIADGEFIAEISCYHGDKSRGNYYSSHYETKLKITKQSKAKTVKQVKDFFNGQVSNATGIKCDWY